MLVSKNPYNQKIVCEKHEHSSSDVYKILVNSHSQYLIWKNFSVEHRIEVLYEVGQNLKKNKDRAAFLITQEMGKPITQSIFEIEKCLLLVKYYCNNAKEILKNELIKETDERGYIRFDPLGVILGVMPWNFPFWQVFRFAIPTLIVGNTVLIKGASNVLGSTELIETIFSESIENKILSALFVNSSKIKNIVEAEQIKGVSLTGGEEAGANLGSIAGEKIKKIVLELGGTDPFIVCEDANIRKASKKAVKSRMVNTGQSCIAAKRFIVHKSRKEEFINAIKLELKTMSVGNPNNASNDFGPLAKTENVKILNLQLKDALDKGANMEFQMAVPDVKTFFPPTIINNINPSMKVYNEETFGPLFTIITFTKIEDAVDIANDTQYGLGSSIWTKDVNKAERLAKNINAGSVFINEMTYSDPKLPFGGINLSGFGRELSSYGLKEFVNIKTVFLGDK